MGSMGATSDRERRQYPRTDARLLVSYCPESGLASYGVGYTRNVSEGGTVFTSSSPFDQGSTLALTLRFPFAYRATEKVAEVVSCKEKVNKLLYETHIRFVEPSPEYI